jgi:hypothetical protein
LGGFHNVIWRASKDVQDALNDCDQPVLGLGQP